MKATMTQRPESTQHKAIPSVPNGSASCSLHMDKSSRSLDHSKRLAPDIPQSVDTDRLEAKILYVIYFCGKFVRILCCQILSFDDPDN
jgi:hypothetical protein